MTFPPPLNDLSPDEEKALNRVARTEAFSAGETIFEEGDEGQSCYFIDEGQVRIELAYEEIDSQHVLEYLEAGDILGELSLLDDRPRSAGAIADTPTETRQVRRDDLERLAEDEPGLAMDVYHALGQHTAQKLRATNVKLAEETPVTPTEDVEALVDRATQAQGHIQEWSEERIQALLGDLAQSINERAEEFAEKSVKASFLGNAHDKVIKIKLGSLGIYQSMLGGVGQGVIEEDADRGVVSWAAPVGIVFGLIPITNPISTAAFKTLISLKSRNALILSFHHLTKELGAEYLDLVHSVLEDHGAPTNLVQQVRKRNSRKKTEMFMQHDDVDLILATGGASMVKAAYSSGNPAIGVGPGNAPAMIGPDADVADAVSKVIWSKTFDNGLICGSEHNLVVPESMRDEVTAELKRQGAALLTDAEKEHFMAHSIYEKKNVFDKELVGQAASDILAKLGIERDGDVELIVIPADDISEDNPLSKEKLLPLISLYTVADTEEALDVSEQLLELDGTGHTAAIHTTDDELITRYGERMPASRIIVNAPSSSGVTGLTTGLVPSLTLGCGTYGGTSTCDNVTYTHLQNVKRIAREREPEVELS
ncbi:MAG: aldehyde dehydrogenase family protein [Salinibacter sp.]